MKKGALIFCLTLALSMILFCMTACQHGTADTPDVLSPAIMIDGVVYYSLGKELDTAPLEKSYSGHVTSVVSEKDLPTQNGEANVQCLTHRMLLLKKVLQFFLTKNGFYLSN